MIGERTTISSWYNKHYLIGWTDFIKEVLNADPTERNGLKEHFQIFSNVYIMSKQRIWSTGIIVAWTPAIYICPGWMWKAPPMFKIPAPPHHPGNLCYHLLWPTICRCFYHCWWFRMCCLINKLHMGPCNPTWTWLAKSCRLGMVTDIKYVHFYVKFIQYSPVCSISP